MDVGGLNVCETFQKGGLNVFLFELLARLRIQSLLHPKTRVSFLIQPVS